MLDIFLSYFIFVYSYYFFLNSNFVNLSIRTPPQKKVKKKKEKKGKTEAPTHPKKTWAQKSVIKFP